MKRNSSYFFMSWAICFVLSTLIISNVWAQTFHLQNTKNHFLPTEKAFILYPLEYDHEKITLRWHIASGYYLYRDHINLTVDISQEKTQSILSFITLPEAKIIQDPYLGEQAVYENDLTLTILLSDIEKADALNVYYQGCAIKGLCYPPVEKSFELSSIISSAHSELKILASEQVSSASDTSLAHHSMQFVYFNDASFLKTLLTFYGLGILLSFTPCVLPMIPILSSIIVGQKKINTKKGFFLSLTYTLSMASVLALLGILAVACGKNLHAFFQHPSIIVAFSALFLYLGLAQLGIGKLSLPNRWQQLFYQWQSNFSTGSYLNAFIMGALATLIASPCVSAPLVGALSFIAQTNHYFYGASALFCLGLGMGTVLLFTGTLGGRYLPRAGSWMHIINKIFASLLFALSIWILSRVLNNMLSAVLWSMWCLLNVYWLGIFSKTRVLTTFMGMLFIFSSFLIIFFIIQGGTKVNQTHMLTFTEVKTLDELNEQLSASTENPTLLKVHADWCVSCKENEKLIFADTSVYNALQNWQLLLLDMSEMTTAKEEFAQHFSIFGPPTLLFFDAKGDAQDRLIGKANSQLFLAKLRELSASGPPELTSEQF